jgi:predicted lipoprotein with Yx(FWY)xxD motif
MRRTLAITVLAAALVTGCGDDDGSGSGETSADAMKKDDSMAAHGATATVVDSQFGRIVADKKGQALYLFDKEHSPRSECYGECADAWPPFLTTGKPKAGAGASTGLLGTTKRRDGKLQVTYGGHPLYYFQGDSPGNVLCHDVDEFGGTWLVVEPSGRGVS